MFADTKLSLDSLFFVRSLLPPGCNARRRRMGLESPQAVRIGQNPITNGHQPDSSVLYRYRNEKENVILTPPSPSPSPAPDQCVTRTSASRICRLPGSTFPAAPEIPLVVPIISPSPREDAQRLRFPLHFAAKRSTALRFIAVYGSHQCHQSAHSRCRYLTTTADMTCRS